MGTCKHLMLTMIILHPSFSLTFFIPLIGIQVFLFLSFMFKQYFIEIIKEVKIEEEFA